MEIHKSFELLISSYKLRTHLSKKSPLIKKVPAHRSRLMARNYICPMKILMVCLGNICRSPLAEGILQHKAWQSGLKWSVESAGTSGFQKGEEPHPLSQKVARQKGIDISQQRARKFEAQDFERFDKIYAMSQDIIEDMKHIAKNKFDEKKVELLLNESFPGKNMDIPDPWFGLEPGFHQTYKIIEEACDAIIKKYSTSNPGSYRDQYSIPSNK